PSFFIDYQNNQFLLDGQPFRYISGSIHYTRIHQSQWKDRLQRVRALGLNAIQYYIPWNYHEIFEGENYTAWLRNLTRKFLGKDAVVYTTDGSGDSFLKCGTVPDTFATVDFGPSSKAAINASFSAQKRFLPQGKIDSMRFFITGFQNSFLFQVRRNHELVKYFKNAVQTWFSVLLPLIKPLLRKNNGPVLMVQIENEYGSYKECDRNYTAWLRNLTRKFLGKDAVVYTTDGSGDSFLKCGTVPDTFATVDFGPSSKAAINASFSAQKRFLPQGKIDSMRFFITDMYSLGASMNFYMIHGGTNFGFWSGAESNAPCITSYDYFAPISEAGDITEKYLAIRSWMKGIPGWKTRPLDVPKNNPKTAFGVVNLQPVDDLSQPPNERNCVFSEIPMSFEQIGQPFGFVLYTRKMETCGKRLQIKQLKDFGYVYLQKKHLGTFVHSYYGKSKNSVDLNGCAPGEKLIVLVENQGRQTFETINDPKMTLLSNIQEESELRIWIQCKINIPNDYTDIVSPNVQSAGGHGVYRGFFNVSMPTDTFLNTTGWGKGVAIVNGKNLGRYWASEGPQVNRILCLEDRLIIFCGFF
ncbi:hypothetical protein Angca_005280, partial [Angiostrongylus cantonensis]